MSKLIFDIETVGEDFEKLDPTTQKILTRWIKKESNNPKEYQAALGDLKDGLGFSPLTGQIIVIGILDYEKNQGTIYFQAPAEKSPDQSKVGRGQVKEFIENSIKFKPLTEKEMLENFWRQAANYQEFISFSGRTFDVPFLMVRSAVHKIKPTKDLMSNRYLNSQKFGAQHIDLLDQLTFYGAVRRKGGLHLWSRAFGIKSPKEEVSGDEVNRLFKEKKFIEIARYNLEDLKATKSLYEIWQNYFRFY